MPFNQDTKVQKDVAGINMACPYIEKRVRIAKETLLVFAPLAKLLGRAVQVHTIQTLLESPYGFSA